MGHHRVSLAEGRRVRRRIVVLLACVGIAPAGLVAQESGRDSEPKHVVIASTILVLDHARVSRLGLKELTASTAGGEVGVTRGYPAGAVRVGTRIGNLDVSAFLDVMRRERAVRRESTQTVVTLSGSAAEVSSRRAVVGAYGQMASAGPALWVEPVALGNGRVRLRVWTAAGEVRSGPFGGVWEDVPVEARTEITVPSGRPVVIATTDRGMERTDSELLGWGSTATATQAWIVVRPRIVGDPAHAFEMPEGIPTEWMKH